MVVGTVERLARHSGEFCLFPVAFEQSMCSTLVWGWEGGVMKYDDRYLKRHLKTSREALNDKK